MKTLKVYLEEGAKMPTRAHEYDAGLDIYTPESIILYAGDSVTVNTKVHLEIPKGYCGLLKSKSGLLVKHCISGEGVIDHGFLGAIHVKLFNNSKDEKMHFFEKGDKLVQLLIVPIETPELELVESIQELYGGDTERGTNSFAPSLPIPRKNMPRSLRSISR